MNALKEASMNDYLIVPTTGRAASCLPHQLWSEDFYHYIISSNGAILSDIKNTKTIFEAKIKNTRVIELLNDLKDIKLGIGIHVENQFVLEGKILSLMGRVSYGVDAKNTISVRNIAEYLKETQYDVEELQIFYFNEKN